MNDLETHGIWRIVPSMTITQIIGQSNFDFQILDCEHGAYDYQSLEQDIRMCHLESNKAYVRVSGLDKVQVQRCLDLDADGIVFPQLNGYDDFETAARLLEYAPTGVRGYNPFVSAGEYGFGDIHKKKVTYIAIIETLKSVDQIDDILSINSLDIIYIGVYDLSAQLNCIGEMNNPRLIALTNRIIDKCKAASKLVSVMVNSKEAYDSSKAKGVSVFVHTIDSHQIKKHFLDVINNLKG